MSDPEPIHCMFNESSMKWAAARGLERSRNARARGGRNLFAIDKYPAKENDRLSLLAELACAKYLENVSWDPKHNGRGDGGVDIHFFGWTIDVKFRRPHYADFNIPTGKGALKSDIGVLACLPRPAQPSAQIQLAGWVFRTEFDELSIPIQYRNDQPAAPTVRRAMLRAMPDLKKLERKVKP